MTTAHLHLVLDLQEVSFSTASKSLLEEKRSYLIYLMFICLLDIEINNSTFVFAMAEKFIMQ